MTTTSDTQKYAHPILTR